MKNIKILAIALIVVASYSNQLIAQETITKQRTKSNNTNERSSGNVTPIDDWQEPKAAASLKTRTKSNQTNERTAGYDLKKATKLRVTPTESGCAISFEYDVKSPKDAASGLATGRRLHKPMTVFYEVSSSDNSVAEVKRPRNPVSGQTITQKGREGKIAVIAVSHGMAVSSDPPISVGSSSDSPPSEIAIDEPGVQKAANSGMGSGKASFSDLSVMSAGKATFKEFTVTKRCDGKTTTISCPDGECDIPLDDCPNGSCDLVCSWSWGATNTGSMSSGSGAGSGRCAAGFSLEIEDGTCTAITKKGDLISSYDLATGKK
ncbi:hypothetical protein [Flavobacterium sp.]|uniref:hypothetical protein n=1 Tax=Flavobacterium sp. TaxID=239 RepID=UPI0038FCEA4E